MVCALKGANSVFHGWRMKYDAKAAGYTMTTVLELMKTKNFGSGMERR
jgi:hypothetical protein